MSLLRPEIEGLEPSGIAKIALPRFTDPSVIPLWIGEGDGVTAEFIREAAKRAIDEGYTFYAHTRGRAELRDAIKAYLDRVYDIDLNPDRISVPGSSMMGITLAAQMSVGHGRRALVVSPTGPISRTPYAPPAPTSISFDSARATAVGISKPTTSSPPSGTTLMPSTSTARAIPPAGSCRERHWRACSPSAESGTSC